MTTPKRKPTKADLIVEIKALRRVGAQMANLCYNLGQPDDRGQRLEPVSESDKDTMWGLAKQWDAIQRNEV